MGRGLAALLPQGAEEQGALRELSVDVIAANPRQPRQEFDHEGLRALADSIRARGVLQPLVVRPLVGGSYELIAGERRLRAAKIAGLELVPAIVRDTEEAERLELALIENMAREDLNTVEEARACATLVEDLGITKEELGRRVGRSRVAVSNLIRLLELPDDVLGQIEAGELSGGHGRALLMCREHSERRRLARDARRQGWSVRETERRAQAAENSGSHRGHRRTTDPELEAALASVSETLSIALGREVSVTAHGTALRAQLDFDGVDDAFSFAAQLGQNPSPR